MRWWILKQHCECHKKWYVMATTYALCDPTRQRDPKGASDGNSKKRSVRDFDNTHQYQQPVSSPKTNGATILWAAQGSRQTATRTRR